MGRTDTAIKRRIARRWHAITVLPRDSSTRQIPRTPFPPQISPGPIHSDEVPGRLGLAGHLWALSLFPRLPVTTKSTNSSSPRRPCRIILCGYILLLDVSRGHSVLPRTFLACTHMNVDIFEQRKFRRTTILQGPGRTTRRSNLTSPTTGTTRPGVSRESSSVEMC